MHFPRESVSTHVCESHAVGSEDALVTEGLSWQMYQAAGNFVAGRSAWINVYVNGSCKGLYSNVEQVDKVYLTDLQYFAGEDV